MASCYIRQGTEADAPAIMAVIDSARAFLGAQKIDQWQGTYPDLTAVREDIQAGTNRVLVVADAIVGTASLLKGPDPFYVRIDDGKWVGDGPYMMIHRFAIAQEARGQHLSQLFMSNLVTEAYALGYRDLRIDTHFDNVIMQHVIEQNGYQYRGVVYLDEPVPERRAYQLLLPEA